MGPDKEQEEAFEGQRIEAEHDAQQEVVAVVAPTGKCPTCGRDMVNEK